MLWEAWITICERKSETILCSQPNAAFHWQIFRISYSVWLATWWLVIKNGKTNKLTDVLSELVHLSPISTCFRLLYKIHWKSWIVKTANARHKVQTAVHRGEEKSMWRCNSWFKLACARIYDNSKLPWYKVSRVFIFFSLDFIWKTFEIISCEIDEELIRDLQFGLNSAPVRNLIYLDDYITTSSLTEVRTANN